jgi:hypothetical protein
VIFEHPNAGAENRRAEIRLQLVRPDGAEKAWIRIVSAAGRSLRSNPGLIEVRNLSPGGCGFRCALRFPASPLLLTELELPIEGERMRILGQIRWRMPCENGYAYGMRFLLGREEKLRVKRALNRLVLTMCPGQAKIHRLYCVSNIR